MLAEWLVVAAAGVARGGGGGWPWPWLSAAAPLSSEEDEGQGGVVLGWAGRWQAPRCVLVRM